MLPVLIITLALMGTAVLMVVIVRDIKDTVKAIKPRKRSKQYLYFYNGRGENPFHVKIGRTNNYIVRLKNQKTARPYGLRILGIVAVQNCEGAERFLHSKFSKNCIEREWFYLTPLLLCTIIAIRDEKLTYHAREKV